MNILNPIPRQDIQLGPPNYTDTITVTGTLKRPPHKKKTTILWTLERSTNYAQIRLQGLLTQPPDYLLPFTGPGFWPPTDPNTAHVESEIIPDPSWDTTDIAITITLWSANHVYATASLYDFKVIITGKIDYLPIMGVG